MPAVKIDISEVEQAITAAEAGVREADYDTVTRNAQRYLAAAVKSLPERTGNLRSAAITPWRHLGIPGRPLTNLEEGEKEVDYLDNSGGRSRMRHARLMSKGTYEDRRNDKDNPSYSYTLFAAEWRGRNKADRHGKFLKKAVDSGILDYSDLRKIMRMINTGVGYAQVWSYIADLFAANPRGRTWLINNAAEGGMWKPYSIFFRGTRKMIKPNTGPFRFSKKYKLALEK